MKRYLIFILVGSLLLLSLGLIVKLTFFSAGQWVCQGGSWVAHGRPTSPVPSSPCPAGPDQLVGNDQDEHGCIGSAGYSWCDIKDKCLRAWEEFCGPPEFDPIFNFMTQLRLETGNLFSYPQAGAYDWLVSSAGSPAQTILLPGLVQTATTNSKSDAFGQYLLDQGYTLDPANTSADNTDQTSGFIKDTTACLLTLTVSDQDAGQATYTLSCGLVPTSP